MLKKLKLKIFDKKEIFILITLLIITATITTYYNYDQNKTRKNFNNLINNIYLKKTTKHFLDKLEPKFKKIRHQISEGETFDIILNQYLLIKRKYKI